MSDSKLFTVHLPFPDADLMPNRAHGKHWSRTSDLAAHQRMSAKIAALQGIQAHGYVANAQAYTVTMVICPPNNRTDVQNVFVALKSAIDGIADAMNINDKSFMRFVIERGQLMYGGAVLVTVQEMN